MCKRNKINMVTKRCFALMLAAGLVFAGGHSAKASSHSYSGKVLTLGDSVKLTPSVTKTNKTRTDAVVTMNVAIPSGCTVSAYVKNAKDNRVTEGDAVKFRGTKSGATKTMPYMEGKGKKGNDFYLVVALENGSQATYIKGFSCIFIA